MGLGLNEPGRMPYVCPESISMGLAPLHFFLSSPNRLFFQSRYRVPLRANYSIHSTSPKLTLDPLIMESDIYGGPGRGPAYNPRASRLFFTHIRRIPRPAVFPSVEFIFYSTRDLAIILISLYSNGSLNTSSHPRTRVSPTCQRPTLDRR